MHKLLFFFILFITFQATLTANVYIQPTEAVVDETTQVNAGTYKYYQFTLKKDEQLNIDLSVSGGNKAINVYLVDMYNFQKYQANQRFSSYTSVENIVRNNANFKFVAPQTNLYYLIVDNRKALMLLRTVNINILKTFNSPTPTSIELEKKYTNDYQALKKIFVFDDFDINVKACGTENAFSNPNITMCSELLENYKKQKIPNAIDFVFAHELAHSLLNIWGYPTYDNEDVADELATVFSIMAGHEESALEAAQYWSQKSSKTSAIAKLYIDDRHTISPQRARNIINWLNRKPELLSRWIKLLLPKMTNQFLKQYSEQNKLAGDDPFSEEIRKRKQLKTWNDKS